MSTRLRAFLARLIHDDGGQDLVEYALLTMAIGFGGVVAAPYLSNAISYVYGTWVNETNELWESPDPAGS
jgi:hypothetical protein